jgi:hypothetical protein
MSDTPYTIVSDYTELVAALRQRVIDLDVTFESVDHVSGVCKGYSNKTIGGSPIKGLGLLSLGPILGALGLKIALVEDDGFEKIRPRLGQRRVSRPHAKGPVEAGPCVVA